MDRPKISVLMSVYNGQIFLRQAIESILCQTFQDFEFLIIDDGSTDKSVEIVHSYLDPRIHLYQNKKNIGLARSLNKGIELAKGEYVARMDADDISLPKRLETELRVALAYPEVILVTTSFCNFIDKFDEKSRHKCCQNEDEIEWIDFQELIKANKICHGSVLFKKENILDLGGYNESLPKAQDYDLWLRISMVSKIPKINMVLYMRRLHFNCVSIKSILLQEKYADNIKNQNFHVHKRLTKRLLYFERGGYKWRAMLRLRNYAHLFLREKHTKEGSYLLLRSFLIYPTSDGLKRLLTSLSKGLSPRL